MLVLHDVDVNGACVAAYRLRDNIEVDVLGERDSRGNQSRATVKLSVEDAKDLKTRLIYNLQDLKWHIQ